MMKHVSEKEYMPVGIEIIGARQERFVERVAL